MARSVGLVARSRDNGLCVLPAELRKLSWNGVPPKYRAMVWQLLLVRFCRLPFASRRLLRSCSLTRDLPWGQSTGILADEQAAERSDPAAEAQGVRRQSADLF